MDSDITADVFIDKHMSWSGPLTAARLRLFTELRFKKCFGNNR